MGETLQYTPVKPDKLSSSWTIIHVLKITTTRSCWMQCRFCDFSHFVPLVGNNPVKPLTLLNLVQTDPRLDVPYDLIKIRGGLSFFEPWSYFRTAIRHIHTRNPAPIQALSAVELMHFHRVEKKPFQELLEELRWAGASSLGPGGSELLWDEWRQDVAPLRLSAKEWLRIHQLAETCGLQSRASLMVFPGITGRHVHDHLAILKQLRGLSVIEIKPFRPTPLFTVDHPHTLDLLAVVQLIRQELPHVLIEINIDHISHDMRDLLRGHGVSRALVTQEEMDA